MKGVTLPFLCTIAFSKSLYDYTHSAYVDYTHYAIDFVFICSAYELHVCYWYVICDFLHSSFD